MDLAFHFLRPGWLLALVPAAVVWWLMWRRSDGRRTWTRWIAPELLGALLQEGEGRRRLNPVIVVGVLWLAFILALAGPSWRREQAPFAEDEAALVIVMKVTASMKATDLPPNRLERSSQKVGDLLELRPGTRNALVAYAGSAHLVMPLTTDREIIRSFAAELDPAIMPRDGEDLAGALVLAGRQFERRGESGAILLVADELGPEALAAVEEHRRQGGVPVHVLLANTNPSPEAEAVAKKGGGAFVPVTADVADVELLARRVRSTATAPSGSGERWRDDGYLLVPLLALIALFWFRKGWVLDSEAP